MTTIVFCDASNTQVDETYAEKIIQEFRDQTGWKVQKGKPIWNQLRDFSAKYCREKRAPSEVVAIFRIAIGCTLSEEDKAQFADVFPSMKKPKVSARGKHVTEVERDEHGKPVEIVWRPAKAPLPKHRVLLCNNDEAENNLGLMTHVWVGTLKRKDKEVLGENPLDEIGIVYGPTSTDPVCNVRHWAELPYPGFIALGRLVRAGDKTYVVTKKEEAWREQARDHDGVNAFPCCI